MAERDFIRALMAPLAGSAAARGLADDAAVWTPPLGRQLVLTHDTMAAGVHFLASDPPGDVGWKLVAVNASDLAAMGARPAGALLSVALGTGQDADWQAG
ncbi:AIR synthase related protein, partial [Polymorphobacter multimanifer]